MAMAYNRGLCRLISQIFPDFAAEMGLSFFTLPANDASVMPLMSWLHSGWLTRNPYFVLPPDAIEALGDDIERRDRWVEFFTLVGMPQLQKLGELLLPNMGILEPLSHAQQDKMFGGLGKKWADYSQAVSVQFMDFFAYLREFDAILHRWSQSDWSILQPAAPMCEMGVSMHLVLMVSGLGAKQLKIEGSSAAAHTDRSDLDLGDGESMAHTTT